MRNRNVFTRLGRPPKTVMPRNPTLSTGERQAPSPMDGLDTAIPASAFKGRGMPSYHDDPALRKGGKVPERR